MSRELDNLRAAQAAKVDAEAALVAAIRTAREAGETMQAIGDILGMTRAGVLYLLKRDGAHVPARQTAAEKRLHELDARWDLFVDQLASAMFVNPDAQREQLRRNTENGKRKRKAARAESAARKRGFVGRAPVDLIPTVKSDGRRAAETYALRYLDEHPLEPIAIKVTGELDEAASLRQALTASTDPTWLHD